VIAADLSSAERLPQGLQLGAEPSHDDSLCASFAYAPKSNGLITLTLQTLPWLLNSHGTLPCKGGAAPQEDSQQISLARTKDWHRPQTWLTSSKRPFICAAQQTFALPCNGSGARTLALHGFSKGITSTSICRAEQYSHGQTINIL
jgi:hypothetical protein